MRLYPLVTLLLGFLMTFGQLACFNDDDIDTTLASDCIITNLTLGTLNRYLLTKNASGEDSTYRVTVARSRHLFGPYTDRQGRPVMDNNFEVVVHRNDSVIGPGHNAEIVTDDHGDDWMLMHGFMSSDPDSGRVTWLCQIKWRDGWPYVDGDSPAIEAPRPYFKPQK